MLPMLAAMPPLWSTTALGPVPNYTAWWQRHIHGCEQPV